MESVELKTIGILPLTCTLKPSLTSFACFSLPLSGIDLDTFDRFHFSYASAAVMRDAWAVGLARHSVEDQRYFGRRIFKALSVQLGDKDFFLGDIISNVDAIAYGALGMLDFN